MKDKYKWMKLTCLYTRLLLQTLIQTIGVVGHSTLNGDGLGHTDNASTQPSGARTKPATKIKRQ